MTAHKHAALMAEAAQVAAERADWWAEFEYRNRLGEWVEHPSDEWCSRWLAVQLRVSDRIRLRYADRCDGS